MKITGTIRRAQPSALQICFVLDHDVLMKNTLAKSLMEACTIHDLKIELKGDILGSNHSQLISQTCKFMLNCLNYPDYRQTHRPSASNTIG